MQHLFDLSIQDHVSDCPHAMILCSNGCLAYHKRLDTDEHQEECPTRQVECSFCQQRIAFKSMKVFASNCLTC